MTQKELIAEAIRNIQKMTRSDLQGWVEAECLQNPEIDAEEVLHTVDEFLLHMV